jgi:hypothetical protein
VYGTLAKPYAMWIGNQKPIPRGDQKEENDENLKMAESKRLLSANEPLLNTNAVI